jgi:hypothetical protein
MSFTINFNLIKFTPELFLAKSVTIEKYTSLLPSRFKITIVKSFMVMAPDFKSLMMNEVFGKIIFDSNLEKLSF